MSKWPDPTGISKTALDRAGKTLGESARNSNSVSPSSIEDAAGLVARWRACHGYPLNTFQAMLRKTSQNVDSQAFVSQRLKRLTSIIGKLDREPTGSMRLSQMQDIAGARSVLKSVAGVDQVAKAFSKKRFDHKLVSDTNYILRPKKSGYRGRHLIFQFSNSKAKPFDGLKIEVQLRTKLQHAWAMAVETVGHDINSELKSSIGPEDWLTFFKLTSHAFAQLEGVPGLDAMDAMSTSQVVATVANMAAKLQIREKLSAFQVAVTFASRIEKSKPYQLITLKLEERNVEIIGYRATEFANAIDRYREYELKQLRGEKISSVLVATDSLSGLKKAYPSFFVDSKQFILALDSIGIERNRVSKR
jgi:putative GTP pyrophosphokinase